MHAAVGVGWETAGTWIVNIKQEASEVLLLYYLDLGLVAISSTRFVGVLGRKIGERSCLFLVCCMYMYMYVPDQKSIAAGMGERFNAILGYYETTS